MAQGGMAGDPLVLELDEVELGGMEETHFRFLSSGDLSLALGQA